MLATYAPQSPPPGIHIHDTALTGGGVEVWIALGVCFIVVALVAILLSLVVDLAYTWLDPRVRLAA